MLKKKAVSPVLLEVLSALMKLKSLSHHRLVGDTALALQLGHRVSIDIDLFSDRINNYSDILIEIKSHFGERVVQSRKIQSPFGKGIGLVINDIKTDILDWNTKFIRPVVAKKGIRLAHKEDILPMKFNTFMCEPEYARYEKKDYVDIASLSREYSLKSMIEIYKEKYPKNLMTERMMIEGLQLHEMADKKPMPKMLNGATWLDVKSRIEESIMLFIRQRIKKK
ncbi:MAG: nucleotidyl transferase AbiEii/AbiGii toxin family protein [Bacteroidia bacterium]|nr:nucleotidyl transferase AbiEii/AbiGii toxin family protein [Bacteroidia bacterium]